MTPFQFFRYVKLVARKSFQLGRKLSSEEEHEIYSEAVGEHSLLMELIGTLTVNWTRVEIALDFANAALIFHTQIKDKQLPISLKRKIAFFKKSFEQISEMQNFCTEAVEIVAEIDRLKEIRHDVVHGFASNSVPGGLREFVRHRYQGSKLLRERKTVPLRAILEAGKDAGKLARRLLHLTERLFPILIADEENQTKR